MENKIVSYRYFSPPFPGMKAWSLVIKYPVIFVLGVILLFGFFLRAYHFSDWLHFELDQARDARVVDTALVGSPVDLPLLGPKAAGTFLRLAPTFYYLQYGSALLFGSTPAGMAFFVALFSTLSILIFYALARRFFAVSLALSLTLLFTVSHYFVMYGRFAWNPNLLPFFILLGLYALLRSVEEGNPRREVFFVTALVSLAVATHFHFLAFLALPPLVVLFLVYKRPRFSWKAWLLGLGLAVLSYFPMILNEIKAGGTNTEEFFLAITEKSSKEDDHVLVEKFFRNIGEHAMHAVVVTTGFEGSTFPSFFMEDQLRWNCPDKCDEGKWYGVMAALLLGLSLILCLIFWRYETLSERKDFLALLLIWFTVPFCLFLPLSYTIAPRFFLMTGPLFFFLIGIILTGLLRIGTHRWIGRVATGVILLVLVGANLFFLSNRFGELTQAGMQPIENRPDRILKERIRVTLEQQETIVDFLQARSQEKGYPVYMFSEPQYRRALKYLMEKRGIQNDVLGFSGIYTEGVYFLILRSRSDLEDALEKYRASYAIGEKTHFGTLVAIELIPFPEAVIAKRQDFSTPEKQPRSTAPPRYTWREFFMPAFDGTGKEGDEEDEEEENE